MEDRHIEVASEIGGRLQNEDAVRAEGGVMVVCDGVGGSPGGAVASQATADFLFSFLERFSEIPNKAALDELTNGLRKHIAVTMTTFPGLSGMATTAVFALIRRTDMLVGWCGDSRAYLIRDSKLVFKTTDHNMVGALVGMGMLTEAQARFDMRRNALTRAVVYASPPVDVAFDYRVMPVKPGDVVILATDGAYQAFSDDEWVETWGGQSLDVAADIVKRRSAALNDDNYSFCATKV